MMVTIHVGSAKWMVCSDSSYENGCLGDTRISRNLNMLQLDQLVSFPRNVFQPFNVVRQLQGDPMDHASVVFFSTNHNDSVDNFNPHPQQ